MAAHHTELVSHVNTKMAVVQKVRREHHTGMGYLERLAELRKRKGLTQAALGEIIGVEQPTIQRWEKGKREPEISQIFALAAALDVDPGTLLNTSIAVPLGPTLYVKGEVAAGVWKTAFEKPQVDWLSFTGRADITADLKHRFGLRVVGDSMNEVYPEGTILECISVFGRVEALPGKRVIVVRTNDHNECEATVKELVERDGELWLVPRSNNPEHMPYRLDAPAPGIVETRIAAVVVSSVRPE